MSSVSVSYLEDKGKQNSEEKKGIIQQDIDQVLQSSVGDSCDLPNFDAFYGEKVGFLPNGPGIMRMNDRIVIQSTWKNGVVNGELVIFDVIAKRILAYMDVADGVITKILDVLSSDTKEDLYKRQKLFTYGFPPANEQETAAVTVEKPKKVIKPRIRSNRNPMYANQMPITTFNSTLVVSEYSETLPVVNRMVRKIVISQHCLCKLDIDFVLYDFLKLSEVEILSDSLHAIRTLCFIDLPALRHIRIADNCCNSKKELYRLTEMNSRMFRIQNCRLLESLSIGSDCFFEFSYFSILGFARNSRLSIDAPHLRSIELGTKTFVRCFNLSMSSKSPDFWSNDQTFRGCTAFRSVRRVLCVSPHSLCSVFHRIRCEVKG